MTTKESIARPYANAVFETAVQAGALEKWSAMLAVMAYAVRDDALAKLLDDPRFTASKLSELMRGIGENYLDEHGNNFIRVLSKSRRLSFLPEIATLFEKKRAEYEKTAVVTVKSASVLSAEQQAKLAETMAQRLNKKVSLDCSVDTSLIGGVVIRAGDLVIDGSVQGRLIRLVNELQG